MGIFFNYKILINFYKTSPKCLSFCLKIMDTLKCLWLQSITIDQISIKIHQMSGLIVKDFFTEDKRHYGQAFDLASVTLIQFSTMFTYDTMFFQNFLLRVRSASFRVAIEFIFLASSAQRCNLQGLHLQLEIKDLMAGLKTHENSNKHISFYLNIIIILFIIHL